MTQALKLMSSGIAFMYCLSSRAAVCEAAPALIIETFLDTGITSLSNYIHKMLLISMKHKLA